MFTRNRYVILSIIGLTAAFAMLVLWLMKSLQFTTDRFSTELSNKLESALFTEAEQRACTYMQSVSISSLNSDMPDITYFEDELSNLTQTKISLPQLEKLLDESIKMDYSIILHQKGQKLYYKTHKNKLLVVKSKIFYTKKNKTEAVQLELTSPYSLFFEELGLLMLASVLMLLITVYCISQQVKIIRAQQKQARIKKDFTYSMIHDMKTPLSTIRLGLTALDNKRIIRDKKKRTKYLQIISTETQHAYNLINRILTISKSESGKLDLNKIQAEFSGILLDIEKNFQASSHKVITFENDINYPYVYADLEYLKEIFYNLIDNSIKYSNEKVTIRISSEKVSKGVVIRVWDNGIGIKKADQKVIFDKYERASASKRTFQKGGVPGFGLGLTYVFQVIDAHHGMVSVDSELGKYTEFTIYLPDHNEKSGGRGRTR